MSTHLCLVSAQPTPNLTPVLDPETAPRRVILLVSPDMRRRAAWLAGVLRERGIRVEDWPIDDPWDIEHVYYRVLELLERERLAGTRDALALNATGGTKPMSIAAYEAFRDDGLPIFYVHPEQDRLIWLSPTGRPSRELADRLRLESFLQAHGARVQGEPRRNVPEPIRLELAQEIIVGIGHFGHALSQLNYLASSAQRSLLTEPVKEDRGPLAELIDLFENIGSLRRTEGRLRFPDEQERFFVNGGWIEAHVFDAVRQLRREDPRIQDCAYALEVEREQRDKSVPNELDVAFLRDNRLHIIECKTKRFRGAVAESEGSGALYKLDSLRDLMGGLQARAMLLSFLDLPDHDRTRAADLSIWVCAGAQLRHLKDHLGRFMR